MSTKNSFFTRFNPPTSKQYGYKTSNVSMTEQSLANCCDINKLLTTSVDKEGRQHAVFNPLNASLPAMSCQPKYGDFSMYTSEKLLEARSMLTHAQQQFDALPSELRARFGNDPAKLVAFCSDSNNYDEGVKLGLFAKKVVASYDPRDFHQQSDDVNDVKTTVTTPPVE